MMKSAKIKMLDKISKSGKTFVIKEEKPDILSSNKVTQGFSSLIFVDKGKTIDRLLNEYAEIFVESLLLVIENKNECSNKI